MAVSYWILSENKYIGNPAGTGTPKKISPESIKSNNLGQPGDAVPTFGSYGHAATTYKLTKGPDGNTYVEPRTVNKSYFTSPADFLKNGIVTQIDDYGMDSWNFAGKDNPPLNHNLISKMPNVAYIESLVSSPMQFPDPRDTQVNLHVTREIVNAVDPSNLGFYVSKASNSDEKLRRLLFDDANRLNYEAVAWVDFLEKNGFSVDSSKNAEIIASGVQKDVSGQGFLAAYYPQKGYLITEEDFHDKAAKLTSRYGLTDRESVEAMKRAGLLHEIAHRLGVGGDRASEKLQGELRAEFYSMLAENFKGTKMERIYRALAREGSDYARAFSLSQWLLGLIREGATEEKSGLEELAYKFLRDGIELGKENLRDYVDMRMEETVGPIWRGEPSYKKSTYSKKENKKYSNKKESLEELIMKDTDGVSITVTKDGTIIPSYKGQKIDEEEAASLNMRYNDNGNAEIYDGKGSSSKYKSMSDAKEGKDAKRGREAPKAEKEALQEADSKEAPVESAAEAA